MNYYVINVRLVCGTWWLSLSSLKWSLERGNLLLLQLKWCVYLGLYVMCALWVVVCVWGGGSGLCACVCLF